MNSANIFSLGAAPNLTAGAYKALIPQEDQEQKASDDKLREACSEFESIFLHHLIRSMRDAGPKSDLLDSGFASDLYKDMLDEQFARDAAKTNSFGLGDLLYYQLRQR